MKEFIKKCPVFLILAVSGALFSLIGVIGSFSVYKEYEFHMARWPYLALMMEGVSKGTMPWEATDTIGMGEDEFPGSLIYKWRDEHRGQEIDAWSGEEAAEGSAGSSDEPAGQESAGEPGVPGDQGKADGLGGADSQGREETEAAEDDRTYSFQTVGEDYFDDAVFIGDSRTVGLFEYGGIEQRADFYAKISLTIYDVFTTPVAKDEETGKKTTVEEALMQKKYGKVYIMLGINELGTGTTETFMKEYEKVVDRIRELQPDAVIYVQGIMKVTGKKDSEDEIFNNTNIEDKNQAIAKLADNRDIFYIDVNEVVCDGDGNLNEEYTIDEVHLKAKYYEIWKQFLLEHGIVK